MGLGLTYALTVSISLSSRAGGDYVYQGAFARRLLNAFRVLVPLTPLLRLGHQLPELGCEEPGRPGGPDGRREEGQQLPGHRVGELRGNYG